MADTTNPSPGTSSTPGGGITTTSPADLGSVYDATQAQLALDAETDAKRQQELAGGDPEKVDPPVYDERGNVRPRGTKGAKPMTFEQRAALARKQDRGGDVPEGGEPDVRKAAAAETKASGKARRRRR